MDDKTKNWNDFLAVLDHIFGAGVRPNLAFWAAVIQGEAGRAKAVIDGEPATLLAFEFGLQIRDDLRAAGGAVLKALIEAGVAALLASLGVKVKTK